MFRIAAALVLLLALAGGGRARAEEQPPAAVLAQMRTGGVSRFADTLPIGSDGTDVLVHLYSVPARSGGATGESESAAAQPYYLDLLTKRENGFKRLHSVLFVQAGAPSHEFHPMWLDPDNRTAPILRIVFRDFDSERNVLVVFPKGVEGEPLVQTFTGETGNENFSDAYHFEESDAHGNLRVQESRTRMIDGKPVVNVRNFDWDGVEFADRTRPFFAIAAYWKTRTEAEAFVRDHNLATAEIRPSGHYPKLTSGAYVVIVARAAGETEMRKLLKDKKTDPGVKVEIKRAF